MTYKVTNHTSPISKLRTLNKIAKFRLPERFYGDGKPHWRVSRHNYPCEKSREAQNARRIAANRLLYLARASSNDEEADRLKSIATIIVTCSPSLRCQHPACSECLRALQRWFTWTASTALNLATGQNDDGVATICIIPDLRLTLTASLEHTRDQVARVLAMLDRAFDHLEGNCLVGGIDISVNQTSVSIVTAQPTEYVQVHVWALGPESQIRSIELRLREAFPTSPAAKDAVRIESWDGDLRAFAYSFKTSFSRRISYLKRTADGGFERNTRNKKLSVRQFGRVCIILEMIGNRRLVMVGANVNDDRRGRPVIRPLTRPKG